MASNHNDTHLSELISATHGRARRMQRNIDKITCQRARRYGMKELGKNGKLKFTYAGVVFIYDPKTNKEVTCYPSRDPSCDSSGTKQVVPKIIEKKSEYESPSAMQAHKNLRQLILADPGTWRSHSVFVVDMSGSMRTDDVNGARCRSDGVFMAIAQDFIKSSLESKTASMYDLVSIISMTDQADVILELEPMDWVLYNKIVDLREWSNLRPRGPGNYMPALDAASKLLSSNKSGSCALVLAFFSDGKPSDAGPFAKRMGEIASKFGRRLTVSCIGIGESLESFATLEDMVKEADAYGLVTSLGMPSLDTSSLSKVCSKISSSLTTSKTEMTDIKTGTMKMVRTDVKRERKGTLDTRLTDEWQVFRSNGKCGFVRSFWVWSFQKNDLVRLLDPRCCICYRQCYGRRDELFRPTEASEDLGIRCGCNAIFCAGCFPSKYAAHRNSGDCVKDNVEFPQKTVPSFAIAIKRSIFDEGAERMVKKCRFLGINHRFVGPAYVAKESRFVGEQDEYKHRMGYHIEFMRTQSIASELAEAFNKALDSLTCHFPPKNHRWLQCHPRVEFLDPMVVEVEDVKNEEYNILIEPMLQGKYTKFNNNMGYVKDKARSVSKDTLADLDSSFCGLKSKNNRESRKGSRTLKETGADAGFHGGLGVIAEGSEGEEEENDDANEIFRKDNAAPCAGTYEYHIPDNDFAQAFSHFTYEQSRKNLIVVDLQGVLQGNTDGTKKFLFTDPVIHKRSRKKAPRMRKWSFGRTDWNEKGMKAFFHTHECTDVCRLLGLSKVKPQDI